MITFDGGTKFAKGGQNPLANIVSRGSISASGYCPGDNIRLADLVRGDKIQGGQNRLGQVALLYKEDYVNLMSFPINAYSFAIQASAVYMSIRLLRTITRGNFISSPGVDRVSERAQNPSFRKLRHHFFYTRSRSQSSTMF